MGDVGQCVTVSHVRDRQDAAVNRWWAGCGRGTLACMTGHTDVNQSFWDEVAPLHAASGYYRLDEFLAGADALGDREVAEVGDVTGRTMAHLMCHIGLDSLSWARRGAQVTGVDFSTEAIRIARGLAERSGIDATFVRSDVFSAADRLGRGAFDIVFLSRGILMWIEDITAWAEACATLLKPGGVFYLLDIHPVALALAPTDSGYVLRGSYFHASEPSIVVKDGSYALSGVGMQHQETREWSHSLGDVVTALVESGIRIEFLHEFPADEQPPDSSMALPGLFSIRGTRFSSPPRSR